MTQIPFGIPRLDSIIGGGAPSGSLVLLAGEVGAGAREFLYTSAAVNGLAEADPELFELHYGSVDAAATLPGEIHYVSFTSNEAELRDEIGHTMSEELVEAGLDAVKFHDLSAEYFQLSPIPREWYARERQSIADLADRDDRRGVLEALGDYLTENAPGNLVVIDSLTDLVTVAGEQLSWSDVTLLLKGIQKATHAWDGLILVLVNMESLSSTEMGNLMGSADGTIAFEWERGGNERSRTMFVRDFRGVLSRIEEENIVQFETEITEDGFDVSDVRKIR